MHIPESHPSATLTVYASFGFVLRSQMQRNKAIGLSPNPYLPFLFEKKIVSQKKRILIKEALKINENNRTEILNFRVTKGEKRMIEDKAFIKYDTLAPYLRDCA